MTHIAPVGGSIELVVGCMFSGKTDELCRLINQLQIARLAHQVFNHSNDTRPGTAHIRSHNGRQFQATMVGSSADLAQLIKPETVAVVIDEGQFFDHGLVDLSACLAKRGVRVIIGGLNTDFRGKGFGPIPELVATASTITLLHAVCMRCFGANGPAVRSQRLINGQPAHPEAPTILVGAKEFYEPRCLACHEVPKEQ